MISPEILRRYPFFAGLDDAFLTALAMISDEVVLAEGVWLFHEEDSADAFYLVLRGTIQLRARLPRNAYVDLDQQVEGDIVGWSAICKPAVYTLGAYTPTGARLIRFEGAAMRKLMEERPEMGYVLMCRVAQEIGNRLADLRNRFVSIATP